MEICLGSLKPTHVLRNLACIVMLVVAMLNIANADDAPFTIGGPEFPPYIIRSDNGELSGMMIDLINESASLANIAVSYNISNWARALKEVQSGRTDAIIPTMYSKDREEYLIYPEQELFTLDMMFFKHRDTAIMFDGNYGSLTKYTIGKLRNARVSPEFDQAIESGLLDVDERSSVTTLMRAVARKRIDLVAIDYPTGMWMLENQNFSNDVKVLNHSLGQVATYLAFSKKRVKENIVVRLNSAMKTLVQNGRRQEILRSYIHKN